MVGLERLNHRPSLLIGSDSHVGAKSNTCDNIITSDNSNNAFQHLMSCVGADQVLSFQSLLSQGLWPTDKLIMAAVAQYLRAIS